MRRFILLACLLVLFVPASVHAASQSVVIGEVYAAGGNAGATYANDFVELFNRGPAAVELGGWSVQYATAGGSTWSPTPLTGSIAPGRHVLVQLGPVGAVGSPLPAPDATGTTNLAASGGKVALVRDSTPILCGASAGSCSATATVQDLVGYGSAVDYEGSAAAPALDATSAAVRADGGCTDTDSNAADFAAAAPSPANASAPAVACGASPAPATTAGVAVDADVAPVISLSVERAALSFGQVVAGTTPAPLSERVTVLGTRSTGYDLTVHRTTFAPADLPLAITSTAPPGATANAAFAGGAQVAIPLLGAADLVVGTSTRAAPTAGDVWPTAVGFTGALPSVAPGRYAATVTFTVIGR